MLIDAGTGNVPDLTVQPDPHVPALVLLTPNARGSLEEMRAMGFAGYLVKPVRQSSLVTRLILMPRDARRHAARSLRRHWIETAAAAPVGELPPLISRARGNRRAPDFDPPAIPAPFMEDHPPHAPQRRPPTQAVPCRPETACTSFWPRTIPSTCC